MTRTSDSWKLVVAVAMGNVIGVMPGAITAFLIGGLMDSRGFDEVEAGVMGTIEMMAVAGTSMLVAPWMARLSARNVAICGVLLAATAQGLSALVQAYWLLAPVRFASGVGAGLVLAAANSAAASARNPDRLYGYAIAVMQGMVAIVTFALAAVIHATGIAGGYLTLGGFFLALLPFLTWLGFGSRTPDARGSAAPLPRTPMLLLLGALGVLGLGTGPTWAFMERVGVGIGMTVERIGGFYMIVNFAGALGPLLAGRLGGRWGRTRPIAVALLGLGSSCLALGYVATEASYLGLQLMFGPFYMFVQTFLMATIAVFDPSGRVGPAGAGLFQMVLGIGPALGGVLVTQGSYTTPGWFAIGMLGGGALLMLVFGRSLNRLGTGRT